MCPYRIPHGWPCESSKAAQLLFSPFTLLPSTASQFRDADPFLDPPTCSVTDLALRFTTNVLSECLQSPSTCTFISRPFGVHREQPQALLSAVGDKLGRQLGLAAAFAAGAAAPKSGVSDAARHLTARAVSSMSSAGAKRKRDGPAAAAAPSIMVLVRRQAPPPFRMLSHRRPPLGRPNPQASCARRQGAGTHDLRQGAAVDYRPRFFSRTEADVRALPPRVCPTDESLPRRSPPHSPPGDAFVPARASSRRRRTGRSSSGRSPGRSARSA